MIQIHEYKADNESYDKSQLRAKNNSSNLTIDLMLQCMCECQCIEYILCGLLIFDPTSDHKTRGHYSTMNMDFNTGSWTGIDDDTVRIISSFPLMYDISDVMDKEKIKSMVYTRANVRGVA